MCRPPHLGNRAMKTLRPLLYLLIGLLLGANWVFSYAATVPYKFNGLNVTREGGATYLRGTSPSEVAAAGVSVTNGAIQAAGSANWYAGTGALLQSGGVTFNAVLPLAATAASVAVTAVRLNPAGLVTSAIASYLLTKGIEYVDGQFRKPSSLVDPSYSEIMDPVFWDCGGRFYSEADCIAAMIRPGWPNVVHGQGTFEPGVDNLAGRAMCPGGWFGVIVGGAPKCVTSPGSCPAGSTASGSQCAVPAAPAQESDWDAARVGMWPDPAILDLVRRGVPLPTDKPVFSPAYKDVPLSDPVVDPGTGKRMQDKARVTPNPSAPDTADVQVMKQEVDAQGNPVVDPATGGPSAPTEETDLCKKHPEASACQRLDSVDDVQIPQQDNPFSLNPISGFGADNASCPPSVHLFNKGGQSIDWSWSQFCTFSQGIRPLVIGFAWLAAIAMVVAVGRRTG